MKKVKRQNKWLLVVLAGSLLGGSAFSPLGQLNAAPASANGAQTVKVSVNQGSASELESLRGVGPLLAGRIIQDRETNGAFKSLEDLTRVPGIGKKKFEKIKEQITL